MYTVVVQVTIQSRVKRKKNADESLRYHEGPTRLRCSVTGLPPVPGALPSVGFSRFASESLAGAPVSSRARFPAAPMIDTPPWLEGPASEEAAAALPRMLSPRPAPWPRPLPGAPEARGAAEASDGLREGQQLHWLEARLAQPMPPYWQPGRVPQVQRRMEGRTQMPGLSVQ